MNIAFSFDPALILSIMLRTLTISGIHLFVIQWVGSKGVSQLTTYQLIIILSLGNIVAEPMINNDAQILTMVTVIVIIILVFKILDYVNTKNKKNGKGNQP